MNYHAVLSTLCLLLTVSSQPAPSDKDVTAELHKEYARSAKAFKSGDLKGLMDVLAPDFTSSDSEGKTTTRDQMEAYFKQQMAQVQQVKSVDFTVKHVGVRSADEAIADTEMKLTGTVERPGDKKRHTVAVTADSVDTWVHTPTGWKLRHVQSGKTATTLDGKPYGPNAPQPTPKPVKQKKTKKPRK